MANNIPLFPMMTDDLILKTGFTLETKTFYYHDETKELKLSLIEGEDAICTLEDSKGVWNAAEDDLGVKGIFSMRNPKALFGTEGVAPMDAKLGVALVWKSADSLQRGAMPIIQFDALTKGHHYEFHHDFALGQFKGNVSFTLTLYLVEPGKKLDSYFADECGTILGDFLDPLILQFDGQRSIFPIYEIALSSKDPLCDLSISMSDPSEDDFLDSVMIRLNVSHKSYHFIDMNSPDFNAQLFTEELAQALFLMVLEVKEYPIAWQNILDGMHFKEGSVCAVINYFIKTLGWNVTGSNIDLFNSIRLYLEANFV